MVMNSHFIDLSEGFRRHIWKTWVRASDFVAYTEKFHWQSGECGDQCEVTRRRRAVKERMCPPEKVPKAGASILLTTAMGLLCPVTLFLETRKAQTCLRN